MAGDGIVVWRAWAVWNERRTVMIVPGFFLFATLAIFLTSSSMRTIAYVNPSIIESDSVSGSLVIAGYTASIATNLSSTVLIGIKAYQHRKFLKAAGIGSSRAARVLMLLTESGVLYIVFQIINVCLAFLDDESLTNSPFNIATHVWGVLMNFIAATYPTLIILIVHNNRSITHSTDSSSGYGSRKLTPMFGQTHISFAKSPVGDESTVQGADSVNSRLDWSTGGGEGEQKSSE
ncbi:hypothetical protein J3R30DRAFT_3407807 [Lentinula aciculospora]|uniref:Uncharacterized protein n=1 Tax=Lentinula aciculospora TaxID=153920 RepID=A0A9W9A0G8_9AGAR|nr:hypothetical protein J3R30DRAFT_3407807 [Lentinula aciculospora]